MKRFYLITSLITSCLLWGCRGDNSHNLFIRAKVTVHLPEYPYTVGYVTESNELLTPSTCIFIGTPLREFESQFGAGLHIQLGDSIKTVDNLYDFFTLIKKSLKHPVNMIPICADKDADMAIINTIRNRCLFFGIRPIFVAKSKTGTLLCFNPVFSSTIVNKSASLLKLYVTNNGDCLFREKRISQQNIVEHLTEYFTQTTTGCAIQVIYGRATTFEHYMSIITALQKIKYDKQNNNPDFIIDIVDNGIWPT